MANTLNPYEPTQTPPIDDSGIRKVSIRPIQLMKRGYALIADQYWMFFVITLVGILIASVVPFGLIMGPMVVGIYLCFIECEQGKQADFGILFRGFDYFLESFIAFLVLLLLSFLITIPFIVVVFVIILGPIIAAANAGNPPPTPQIPIALFIAYPLMLIASVAVTLPFMFTFQLIADRKLKALPAIKASARGVMKNLFGAIWFAFVIWLVSVLASLLCYFPTFLFMPIAFASFFVLYRDVYGVRGE